MGLFQLEMNSSASMINSFIYYLSTMKLIADYFNNHPKKSLGHFLRRKRKKKMDDPGS